MAAEDGRRGWPPRMAAEDGRRGWPPRMAAEDGRRGWALHILNNKYFIKF
jgi:hypothetical protein